MLLLNESGEYLEVTAYRGTCIHRQLQVLLRCQGEESCAAVGFVGSNQGRLRRSTDDAGYFAVGPIEVYTPDLQQPVGQNFFSASVSSYH